MSSEQRHRLTDIISALPLGAHGRIADILGCSIKTVSNVLNGKQGQNTDLARNIIRLAERIAKR
jgi:predicted transcriptional regulator